MKKIFLFVFALLCFTQTLPVFAEFFYIKNYNVDINVNKNKTLEITELIDVYFESPRHGIFRSVPYSNTITRADGSREHTKSKISDIEVNDTNTKTYQNGSLVIKIGDPQKTISGDKTYRIKYNYSIPKPKTLKNNDEFYFNIIGNDWDTNINNVHFKISMPKEFDKKLVGFSIGRRGIEGYNKDKLQYQIKDKVIEGTTSKLNNNEGVTIRIELPKEYFEYKISYNENIIFLSAILILFSIISYFVWYCVGKDDPIIPVVSFKPPKDLNSALTGAYYREDPNNKDIVSLIIQLTSKGYIKIESNKTDSKDFTFYKLKDFDNANSFEKKLMNAMFCDKSEVTLNDLAHSKEFYLEVESLKAKLKKNCKKLYTPESLSFSSNLIPVVSIILSCFGILYSVLDYDLSILSIDMAPVLIFPVFAIIIFVTSYKNNPIFVTCWALLFGVMPLFILISELGLLNFDKFTFFSIILLITNSILASNIDKKSKNALKLLGKIHGFKKFLEVAEKHRIELLAKENPLYCFDVLPYAYVLGVSDEFIKKFEKIIHCDYWNDTINPRVFNNFTNACYTATQPSVANGGISSSSGGGFSGGGCGGGGGGSW